MPAGIRKYLRWHRSGTAEPGPDAAPPPVLRAPPVVSGAPAAEAPVTGRETADPSAARETMRTLAHELRSPLTALKSSLQLVAEGEAGPLNEDQSRFLGLALRNLERLDRLATTLLDRERGRAADRAASPRRVDLGPMLRDAVRMHEVAARRAGLDFDVSGLPESFEAEVDPDRLQQIVDNLVGNALKFTPAPGLVHVWLERRTSPAGGLARDVAEACGLGIEQFALVVADSGRGIAPERQARLFEVFARVHDEDKLHIPGSGLGLHIVRDLVGAMGGTLSLASRPGQGTTVWVRLPRTGTGGRVLRTVAELETAAAARPETTWQAEVLDLRAVERPVDPAALNEFARAMADRGAGLTRRIAPGLYLALVARSREWTRAWARLTLRPESGAAHARWRELGRKRQVTGPVVAQLV